MSEHIYDIAVVGGGMLGTFSSFYLARRGFDVCTLERGYPASGTSGHSHAWVYVSTKTPGSYGRFSLESSYLYESIEKEFGVDLHYERSGGMQIIWTQEAFDKAPAQVEEMRKAGVRVELLSAQEVHEREPIISPEKIAGAYYGSDDGHVNPYVVLHTIAHLARKQGVNFRFYSEVKTMEHHGEKFLIRTNTGEVKARRLLIAAGAWTPGLARQFGVDVPITTSRGQVMVSEPLPPTIHHVIANGSLRQLTDRGVILMGRVSENAVMSDASTYEGLQKEVRDILNLAPSLSHVRVVRTFAGIRPMPFDELPLIGPVPGQDGLFVAVTHSGVTLGPILGLSISELVAGEKPTYDAKAYLFERSLNRTNRPKSAAH